MVFLKIITIYAFLAFIVHVFIVEYLMKQDCIPEVFKDAYRRSGKSAQVISTIIMTPLYLVLFLFIAFNQVYSWIRIGRFHFRAFRLRGLLLLCDRWKWYEKKLFKRRLLFYISILLFSRYNVINFMNITAGCIVGSIFIDAIKKFSDESKNANPIPDEGEAE